MELYQSIPDHLKPLKEENSRLFRSNWKEKITRTSLKVPVIMHASIAVAFLYYAITKTTLEPYLITILFISGALFWTFAEYWVHRGGYHTHTKNRLWLKIQYLGHGIHHQHPKDAERLAMPPLPAILLISLIFGLFWLIGGVYSIAFFPGFLVGYMIYIILHYAQHRYLPPNFLLFKKLWRHHVLHHYKYPETKAFGVSTRLWDYVFGTMP